MNHVALTTFLKKSFGEHKSFTGLLIPLFWTSGDVSSGFQSQVGFPRLHALSPVYNKFLGFTSGPTPADLLTITNNYTKHSGRFSQMS